MVAETEGGAAPEQADGAWKIIVAVLVLLSLAFGAASFLFQGRGDHSYPGYESAAVGSLRTITTAQQIFREDDRNRDGVFDYGDLTELGSARLIDTVLSAGVKRGYRFFVVKGQDGAEDSELIWWAAAEPVNPGETGDRYFFTNQSGRIYYSNTAPIRPIEGSKANDPAGATEIGGR